MKEAILRYIVDFLEVNHRAFQNLPPCPYAKRERLDGRILFLEWHFESNKPSEEFLEHIRQFLNGSQYFFLVIKPI